MPRYEPDTSPDFVQLKAIRALIESRVRPEARVTVLCYYLSQSPRDPSLGYIGFQWESDMRLEKITQSPGIPRESLVPEKVLPIAQWIVRQISKQHPEWFI